MAANDTSSAVAPITTLRTREGRCNRIVWGLVARIRTFDPWLDTLNACIVRFYRPALTMNPAALTDAEYQQRAHAVLDTIESHLDVWLQTDVADIDGQRTGGLLEMTFPNRAKIVVNMQPPLHELWLAAKSGGYHFRWVDGDWRDTRDGVGFYARLSACASAEAGRALDFAPRTTG